MNPSTFLWLALAGLLVTGLAAIGTKVLNDFSRHELSMYCRRRQRTDLFNEIMDDHDVVARGSQSIRIVGSTVMIVCLGFWLADDGSGKAPGPYALTTTILIGSALLLVATSWIPFAVVRLWSAPFLYHTWRIWTFTNRLCWPLTVGVKIVDALMRRLAGRPEEEEDEEEAFEEEIRTIVSDGEHDGLLESDAREMIEGVINLGDTDVSLVMTPRSRIDAVDVRSDWDDVLRFVIECRRTRIPVYEETLDNVVGILYVKDLLTELAQPPEAERTPLRELARTATKIPSTKPVDAMLRKFRDDRNHLAIVVGEYGEVMGVVTIEDILEEIVGEIVDEHDRDEELPIRRIDETTIDAQGRTRLEELSEVLGIELPEPEDYNTISGLIVERLGYIPKTGESLHEGDVLITVTEANPRRIERVKLQLTEPPSVDDARSA